MDPEELKRAFGRRVRELRLAAGLTQEQLAERIDRTVDTVGNIERGANSTGIETMGRLAQTFGVELAELFEAAGPQEAARGRRRAVAKLVKALNAQDDAVFERLNRLFCEALSLAAPSRGDG